MMPHLAHPEGHRDRYLCILSAGGGLGRIGAVVRSSLSIERYLAIIHSLRQRGGFTERRSKIKPFRLYKL